MIDQILKKIFWKLFNAKKIISKKYFLVKDYSFISNEEIFKRVYEQKIWNKTSDLDFDSGPGSHNVDVLKPYLDAIISFLNENRNMIIIDLGCGDFNVGSNLVKFSKKYIAIDVVGNLIDRNKFFFKSNRLIFKKIDVVYEDIPAGDCILIKEVFQHITNKEIKMILKKLINFKYLIITESEPLNNFKPNKNKLRGPDCRTDIGSGIIIDKPPFNFSYQKKKELMRVRKDDRYIVTTFYQTY